MRYAKTPDELWALFENRKDGTALIPVASLRQGVDDATGTLDCVHVVEVDLGRDGKCENILNSLIVKLLETVDMPGGDWNE